MGCTGSKEKHADCTAAAAAAESPSPRTTTASTNSDMDRGSSDDTASTTRPALPTRRNQPTSTPSGKDDWHSVRQDVANLLQNLDEEEAEPDSEVSLGHQEYARVLKRWLKRCYRDDTDPGKPKPKPKQPPVAALKDPNDHPFPVPENVESLRGWLETWAPLDTGLGEGEQAAWSLLPQDVIKNGLTTPQQQGLLAARGKRRGLRDPERMRKRREELAMYFVRKYRMKKGKVSPYLAWADLMARNQADLERLINGSNN